MKKTYAVIGGDDRQGYLANLLQQDGYHVVCSGLENCPVLMSGIKQVNLSEAARVADVVILPLPITMDGITIHANNSYLRLYISDLFGNIKGNALLTGGKIDDKLSKAAKERGIQLEDYLTREEMSVLNAIPTALPRGE